MREVETLYREVNRIWESGACLGPISKICEDIACIRCVLYSDESKCLLGDMSKFLVRAKKNDYNMVMKEEASHE